MKHSEETKKSKFKLNKAQKKNLQIIFAWYNFAWAMSNKKHKEEQKRIADNASEMIEDIILNNK